MNSPEFSRPFRAAMIAVAMLANAASLQAAGNSAITFFDSLSGKQKLYNFVIGPKGHLWANYWNGSGWDWQDHGLPPGALVTSSPSTVTYYQGGAQHILVFVVDASTGHLFVNYWNDGDPGSLWRDQGVPTAASWSGGPSAVNYPVGAEQNIFAFVNCNGLWVNYWNGHSWLWANQNGGPFANDPSAVVYPESGSYSISVFGTMGNGNIGYDHLLENQWRGAGWAWVDYGSVLQPDPNVPPSVITFPDGNNLRQWLVRGLYVGNNVQLWTGFNTYHFWSSSQAPDTKFKLCCGLLPFSIPST